MSHCVPEWDAVPGKEMDSVWEPVDLFLPSKGKWDSGHTRRSDISSVPELNFEELCWEDGQLLVVLQGSSGRGIGKSRSCSQFNAAEANLGGDIHMDVPVDTNGTELIEPASINVQTQEDDLFSWLQHPSEDLMGRHERKNDMHVPGTSLAGTERIHSPDLIMQKYSYQNPGLLNSTENIMASKTRATDTIPAFSPNNKVGHRTNQEVEDNSMNIALQNQEICGHYRPLTPTTEMSTQVAQMPSASANEIHARSVTSVNKSGMKFSNFSRPAVTYKAGLNSLGMTNGISGTERLKQLDRVAVDVHKLEGMDSTTRYLKLNAPSREEGVVLATPSLPHVVGASGLQDSNQDFSPEMQEHINAHSVNESQEDRDPDASITVTLNRTSAMGIADCWKSSLISSTAHGIDGSGEVVEFPEPSDLSSSGGSEDSDGTDGRRVTGRSKRKKSHEEDSELQSEALKNEAASSKKPAVMVGNTTKRSRAAENHNQSERRRRDRISEKMKALQSLVPNSYKTDKASMLEEAITYIKALKSQIQMMSCRGGMFFPQVVFPSGMQNVQMASWPVLNMGIGMNMGMGMNVGVRMTDVNGVVASAPMKPLSPMTSFPTAMRPPVNMTASTSLNPPHMTTGVAGQVIALPANQVLPVRPGVPVPGFCDSSSFSNGVLPQCFPINQQGGHVQMMPIGVQGNAASNFCQYYGPANFLGGCA